MMHRHTICCTLLQVAFLLGLNLMGLQAASDWGNCRADSLFHEWQSQPPDNALADARAQMMAAISSGDCDAFIAAQTWMLSKRNEASSTVHFATMIPGCDTSMASSSYWYQWGVLSIMEGREMEAEMALWRANDLACHKMDKINALNAQSFIHQNRNDFHTSWQLMREAYAVDSINPDPMVVMNLAYFALQMKRYEDALYWARRGMALEEDPIGQQFSLANLCLAHIGLGHAKEATGAFERLNVPFLLTQTPGSTISLILRYALAMADAAPLLTWLDVIRDRWSELNPQQRSLFGWEHLLLDIPQSELSKWMQLKAVVPEDLGGQAFQTQRNQEQKKVGSSVIWAIERQEMRLKVAAATLWLLALGLGMIAIRLKIKEINQNQLPKGPQAYDALMSMICEGKLASGVKPVWLYDEYLRGISLKDQALQHLPRWFELTSREQDVIRYAMNGYSPKEIAQAIGCSPEHVYNMRTRIRSKLGIEETMSLRKWVQKHAQLAKLLLLCLTGFGWMKPCAATAEIADFKTQTTWLTNVDWPDQAAALDSALMHWIPTLNATKMRLPEIRIWTLACLLADQEEGLRKMAPVVLRMTELDSAWVAEELQGLRWAYDPWYEQWSALWRIRALELENTSGQIQSQITPRHILKAAAPDLYRHDRLNAHAMATAWHEILELEAWAQQNWKRDKQRCQGVIAIALLMLVVFAYIVARLRRKQAKMGSARPSLPAGVQEQDRRIRDGLKALEEKEELGWLARVDLARDLQNLAQQDENRQKARPDLELTRTEMRFAILLLLGRTTEDIAGELNCSKSRIYNIRAKLRTKLDIDNTTSLSKTLRDRWSLGRRLLEAAGE